MKINQLHEWEVTPAKAQAIQKGLRPWIMLEDQLTAINTFLRIHVRLSKTGQVSVRAILMNSDFQLLEHASAEGQSPFKFQPGLSAFCVAPFILSTVERLEGIPDLIVCDGHGIRSNSSFGVASHIGLLTNTPTIGVKALNKTLQPLMLEDVPHPGDVLCQSVDDDLVSALVNVSERLPLIVVSPGHQIGLESALKIVTELKPQDENEKALRLLCSHYLRAPVETQDEEDQVIAEFV